MQTQQLLETIRIHSWGTNAVQGKYARGPGQLNFRGTFCELTLTAILPENSIDKYGAYLNIQGGPMISGAGSGYATDMADHRRETISLGCTIVPGSKTRQCSVKLIPPRGYALDQRFVDNSLYVDFFTVDPVRIHQLRTTHQLTPNQRMYVDLVHQWKRCSPEELKPAPKPTQTTPQTSTNNNKNNVDLIGKNIVNDRVVFGPTEFSLADLDGWNAYFEVDYRTYFIEAVTGVDYEVVVGQKLPEIYPNEKGGGGASSKKRRTPLTVFFAKEPKDFYLGISCDYDPKDKTGTECIPPTALKLNGTKLCEGFTCKGSLRGLDPKQQYFLWVSYPRYLDPSNKDLDSSKKKMKSPYATEMVTVNMWAKEWSLGKVNTETISDGF